MRINWVIAFILCYFSVFSQDWSYTTFDFASKTRDRHDFKSKLVNDSILYIAVEGTSNGYGKDYTDIAVIDINTGVILRKRQLNGFGSTPLALGVGYFNKVGYLVEYDTINDIGNPSRLLHRNYRFYSYGNDSVLWSGSGSLSVLGSGMPFNGHVLRDSSTWFQDPITKRAFRINLYTGDTLEDVGINILAHRMSLDTSLNNYLIRLDSKYIVHSGDTIMANGLESYIDSNGIIQLEGYSYVIDAMTCANITGFKLAHRPVVFRNTNIQFDEKSRLIDSTTILWNKGYSRRVLGMESVANGVIVDSVLVIDSLYYNPDIARFGQDHPYDYELYRNGSYLAYVESVTGPYFRDTLLDNKHAMIRLYNNGVKQYELRLLDTLTRNGGENTEISNIHILSDGSLILIMDLGDDNPYTTSRILKVNSDGSHGLSNQESLEGELKQRKIAVYPTVFKDFLNIDVSDEDMTISIFNLSGESFYEIKIGTNGSRELNLVDLPSGLYFLRVDSLRKGSTCTLKIFKK
tara:strand:- start:1785 stop:3341 length:1557 start_codon:yes stop_codon:yes gene_type:complete